MRNTNRHLLPRYDIETILDEVRVINAVGYATRLGNTRLDSNVSKAMVAASGVNVNMARLQFIAGSVLAKVCHAESGYVVNSASGGLTLAIASCIARMDVAAMDDLPFGGGMQKRSIVAVVNGSKYQYKRAIHLAGADTVDVSTSHLLQTDLHIDGQRPVAILWNSPTESTEVFQQVAQSASARNIPLVVDGALMVPPRRNLHAFIDNGANLVVISGGKGIGGPAASAFVVGDAELISSIALQNQDMDADVSTWDYGDFLQSGRIERKPRQGIGRGFKIGKEEICGLLVALQNFLRCNDEDTYSRERDLSVALLQRLQGGTGYEIHLSDGSDYLPSGPCLILNFSTTNDRSASTSSAIARRVARNLANNRPAVYVNEDQISEGILRVVPSCLTGSDLDDLSAALVRALKDS